MVLDKNDLKEIEKIVKKSEVYLDDKIEFTVAASEQRLEARLDAKIDKKLGNLRDDIVTTLSDKIDKEVDSLAEMNREFLDKMDDHSSKIKNHEIRIKRLEIKAMK